MPSVVDQESSRKTLRIAIAAPNLEDTGGIERFVAGLSNYLAEQGHQMLCFHPSKEGTTPRFTYHENVEFIQYKKSGSQKSIKTLHQKILQHKPDVVIVPCSFNLITLWTAALFGTDIPLLYSEHNDPWIIINERWNKSEREAILWLADNIHVLMPTFISSIPETLQYKTRVIYNPLGLSVPQCNKSQTTSKQCTILSLGRLMREQKQIRLLIAAFALLAHDFPQWKLDIWGTGPDEQALREQIAALPHDIQQRVRLCGLSTKPSEQYCTADIFCIPSKFEGFGLTVTEAMAHTLPVVGFVDCNGVNELIHHEENGLLAAEMTAENLAAELRCLMQDATLRQRLGQQAKKDAQNFAPECIYPQWEEFVYTTASKKRQPQHSRLYAQDLSQDEQVYQATMLALLKRRNIRKDVWYRYRLRKWIRKHPTHVDMINGLLRKLGLAIIA